MVSRAHDVGRFAGRTLLAVFLVVPLVGCADAAVEPAAQPVASTVTQTVTATATATVTETITETAATATATSSESAAEATDSEATDSEATAELPTFELSVIEGAGGCAVSRTEGDADNLTWSVRDSHGLEVLGRNALGETTYGYFQSGTFTMVLRAWSVDRYVDVSNEVTINC